MSDTTAYLAGCATTGVAALVLLVARVGMVSANADADSANRLDARIERIEATTSNRQSASESKAEQAVEEEIRKELEKQRDLTKQLEAQLSEQETLSQNLEEQIQEQEDNTKDLLNRIQDYQRSVEDMEIEDKIAAATRSGESPARSGPPASVIWLGAGVVVVLVMGGGGLLLCAVLLVIQSQRRSARSMHMPQPMPMPPAGGYRYYDPAFLPPAQFPPRRSTPTYYDYPPPPYDYTP